MRVAAVLLPLLAGLVACGGTDGTGSTTGPLMSPGQDCLRCHGFTAAGTVFSGQGGAGGVTVVVGGVTLTTNAAGNFYTGSGISFPAQVQVTRGGRTASMNAPSGACNGCHGASISIQAP